jgi:hypothetical protein
MTGGNIMGEETHQRRESQSVHPKSGPQEILEGRQRLADLIGRLLAERWLEKRAAQIQHHCATSRPTKAADS